MGRSEGKGMRKTDMQVFLLERFKLRTRKALGFDWVLYNKLITIRFEFWSGWAQFKQTTAID